MAGVVGEITAIFVTIQCFIFLKCLKKVRPNIKRRYCYKVFSKCVYCGPVLLFIISSIIFYFIKLIEMNFTKKTPKFIIFLHYFFVIYIWINVLFNYLAVMVTGAGKTPEQQDLLEENVNISKFDFCKICNRLRCYGTHHCSQCNVCVRMLCHHSSFLNNCIGLSNFAYYFCFLAYSTIGLFYMICFTYGPFYACYLHNHRLSDVALKYPAMDIFVCDKAGELPLIFFAVITAFIIIGSLFTLHVMLLAADLSFISFVRHIKESKDLLKFFKNFIKKCFTKHQRTKFKVLLFNRKTSWKHFFFPSLNTLAEGLTADDLFEDAEYCVHIV